MAATKEKPEQRVVGFFVAAYEQLGLPRLIITLFVLLLFVLAFIMKMDLTILIGDSLVRIGMNGVLALSMLPTIACGVGLNFGLPVGVIAGLVGAVMSMNWNLQGFAGFFVAIGIALPVAMVAGYIYALILERVQGQEMMVGTYVGFSIVSAMCMFWLLAPIKNPAMIFAIGGQGLRYTITLDKTFAKVLNNFLAFDVLGVTIPTGLLLFFALLCVLMSLFFRSRAGLAMRTVGSNPMFAKSSGMNVRYMKMWGVILSTVLAAVGIIVFSQSYGFVQLYTAPLYAAFPAVASVLIGGATLKRATVGNAIIGVVLFHTLLTIALPVTQTALRGADISEVARMIVSNGMILYALTRAERR
ncbi:MAG: ABC transporter permease [Firmicutes bacterium]|jgi:simple sugar transport system permease protein|nr:ABC transporter permease [Bacillota bacterium]MDD4793019.1 ABC transporter permease [Bacillota bacterium]